MVHHIYPFKQTDKRKRERSDGLTYKKSECEMPNQKKSERMEETVKEGQKD